MDQAKANRSIFWNDGDVDESSPEDLLEDDSSNVLRCSMEWDELVDVADPTPDFFFDGEETKDETDYLDMPDDIHLKIIAYLDLPSRLSLRVNKRLDGLQLCVKNNLEEINVKIGSDDYKLTVKTADHEYRYESRDFDRLEKGLNRLALNTHVVQIRCEPREIGIGVPNGRIIEALFHFDTDNLLMGSFRQVNLPDVDLSTLLTIGQTTKKVDLNWIITSLTAQDLCTLRNAMLEGGCKMEHFHALVMREVCKSFVEACFGITIEDAVTDKKRTRAYRTADESVQLYGNHFLDESDLIFEDLSHYEGNFRTSFNLLLLDITFDKSEIDANPGNHMKVKFNHPYEKTWTH